MVRKLVGIVVSAAIVLVAGAGSAMADGPGDERSIEKLLTNNSIIYTDEVSGLETTIYFGRFGNFDRYVPCTFTDGSFKVSDAGEVCLRDREGARTEMCFKPTISGNQVSWKVPDSRTTNVARLLVGNKLPIG